MLFLYSYNRYVGDNRICTRHSTGYSLDGLCRRRICRRHGNRNRSLSDCDCGTISKAFKKDVSEGNNYQGKFFKLTESIDLSDHRWVPIGLYKWESGGSTTNKSFQGFLDGNYKMISGLMVDERTDKYSAGLLEILKILMGIP